jgi:DNA-binding beta-propeller fold protein YncE
VIDGTTNAVTATIGVGIMPIGVGVDPATNTIYVSNEFGDGHTGTVSVINGATNTITTTVGVPSIQAGVGVDLATHAVYVANVTNTVSVIRRAGRDRRDGH